MKTTSNKDMLNAIRNQASDEYKEKVPVVLSEADDTTEEAKRVLNAYPTLKNEFIDTLINKVVKTEFFSRVYSNPLKQLKKGTLAYGASIEELFVKHAEAKGFLNKEEGPYDEAKALVGTKTATINKLYVSRNFAYVFKVSISDAQLKSAFLNPNGLSELVNQLIGSLTSGAEFKEYKDMIEMITAAADAKRLALKADGTMEAKNIEDEQGVAKPMKIETVGKGAKELAKKIRGLAGRMKFMSADYNMAGVETFCNPEDLVLLVEPETMAELDVDVLADAFNVSKAEMNVRTILVDKLPTRFADGSSMSSPNRNQEKTCKAILMDRNFIQAIDTVNESRQFENGRALTTNVFLHKQGILANCYFANAVAICE